MQCAEIELKFPIGDVGLLQSRLPELGFVLETPRTFEQNTLYDTQGRTLRQASQLLRIRRYGDLWTLTHKRKADRTGPGGEFASLDSGRYKVRIETESRVEDGSALATIFGELGYIPVFRYEKFRTEWMQGHANLDNRQADASPPSEGSPLQTASRHLVIDETPIGNYAELEGPPDWIDETIARLGVDPVSCTTESYGRLFLAWKQKTGSGCENLTYDEIEAGMAFQSSPG